MYVLVNTGAEGHRTSDRRSTAERMYGHVESHPEVHFRWRDAGPATFQKVSWQFAIDFYSGSVVILDATSQIKNTTCRLQCLLLVQGKSEHSLRHC